MTQKHTPAPWKLGRNGKQSYRDISCADNFAIAQCFPYGNEEDLLIASANATLIAAAPELLEALDKICIAHAAWHSCMISGGDADAYSKCKLELDDSIYEAQAAIAKAAGK